MGIINLTEREKAALKSQDERALDRLLDLATRTEDLGPLYQLRLSECGPHVAGKLHYFEQAIRESANAKSDRKREETYQESRRAASALSFAVSGMKARMAEEERDGELFRIDDHLRPPHTLSENLHIRVNYQWRKLATDPWIYGSITYYHKAGQPPDYYPSTTKRKPSRAQVAREHQDDLAREWEHLETIALHSLREFFREGGDGTKVPDSFTAKVDHLGALNNFSAEFWRDRP